MSKRFYVLLFLGVLFGLILGFILIRSNKTTDLNKEFVQLPVPQDFNSRTWKDIRFKKNGISEGFISSLHMRISQNNYVFVADNNEKVINQFNLDGKLKQSFGKGEGRGPGEFLGIIDIMIDQSGNIWGLDDRNNTVTVFDVNDSENFEVLNFPEVFNRVIPAGNNSYWLERKFDNQMKKYSLSGEYLGDAEAIVETPTLWSFVLESYAALTLDGSVIQSQYHTNLFLKYSKEGKILFFREPIEFLGYPKIDPYYANEVGKMNTVDFTSWKQITRNPQVVNNTIQLFVHQKVGNRDNWRKGFMDVYSLENGDYLYSYELPERLESVAISSDYLAGISEELGKVVVWKYQ
tara:strand:+ start:364 stop:1410 length:1047 start_codon:yes stop_codon:yes gene_type:complete